MPKGTHAIVVRCLRKDIDVLKRIIAILLLTLCLGVPVAVAQELGAEPGVEAADPLPDGSMLGPEWERTGVVGPDVLIPYGFEMSPNVFRGGAAGIYMGPGGARAVIVNLEVTDSRVAIRSSWEAATDLLDQLTLSATPSFQRAEALERMAPPEPCVEARRFEGIEDAYHTPVGATMCAPDAGYVWIFLVSGSLNGVSGAGASDTLVDVVLGGETGDAGVTATPVASTGTAATPIAGIEEIPADGRFLGRPDAPVDFVFYADFQCPFCKQFDDRDLPPIIENFVISGDVRVEWRPMPIISAYVDIPLDSPDNESVQAAEAAMCAADQDRFWPYSQALFAAQGAENSGVFTDDMLKQTAAGLELDTEQFNACLDSGEKQDDVLQMMQEGFDLGVSGTPAFLINDQLVSYTRAGYDRIEEQLNDALAGRPVEN